jgi:hypothetical protein
MLIAGGAATAVLFAHRSSSTSLAVDPRPPGPDPLPPGPSIDGLLALHPKDSVVVGGVSLGALRERPLVKKLAADTANKDLDPLRAMLARCGDETVSTSDRIVISVANGSMLGSPPIDVSVQGEASQAQVEQCLTALLGAKPSMNAPARGVVHASTVAERLTPKASVRDDADLRELTTIVDPSADAWIVVSGQSSDEKVAPDLPPPKGIYLTVRVDTALHLHGGMRFASAKDAGDALKVLERELDKVKKDQIVAAMFLKDVKLEVADRDVVATWDLAEGMSKLALVSLAQSLSPGGD